RELRERDRVSPAARRLGELRSYPVVAVPQRWQAPSAPAFLSSTTLKRTWEIVPVLDLITSVPPARAKPELMAPTLRTCVSTLAEGTELWEWSPASVVSLFTRLNSVSAKPAGPFAKTWRLR